MPSVRRQEVQLQVPELDQGQGQCCCLAPQGAPTGDAAPLSAEPCPESAAALPPHSYQVHAHGLGHTAGMALGHAGGGHSLPHIHTQTQHHRVQEQRDMHQGQGEGAVGHAHMGEVEGVGAGGKAGMGASGLNEVEVLAAAQHRCRVAARGQHNQTNCLGPHCCHPKTQKPQVGLHRVWGLCLCPCLCLCHCLCQTLGGQHSATS
mmetsp:Transcript_37595/g.67020  ORF Transcript_37595/g.67020 Transcript_37595/m.67020 type:complete len:205 (-) Transcript_37595:66-680(-)